MKRHHRDAIDFVRSQGATNVRLTINKHSQLTYEFNGRVCRQVFASTPSDHRWFKNFQRDFRNRTAGAAATSG